MNEIFTPPAVKIDVEPTPTTGRPAGFWIRVAAYMIDSIIMNIVVLVVMMVFGILWLILQTFMDEVVVAVIITFIGSISLFIISLGYYVIGWSKYGTTLGKKVLRLRVIDTKTNGHISLSKSIGRIFFYILSGVPVYLGFFWIGWDENKEAWHDKICHTQVIIED